MAFRPPRKPKQITAEQGADFLRGSVYSPRKPCRYRLFKHVRDGGAINECGGKRGLWSMTSTSKGFTTKRGKPTLARCVSAKKRRRRERSEKGEHSRGSEEEKRTQWFLWITPDQEQWHKRRLEIALGRSGFLFCWLFKFLHKGRKKTFASISNAYVQINPNCSETHTCYQAADILPVPSSQSGERTTVCKRESAIVCTVDLANPALKIPQILAELRRFFLYCFSFAVWSMLTSVILKNKKKDRTASKMLTRQRSWLIFLLTEDCNFQNIYD